MFTSLGPDLWCDLKLYLCKWNANSPVSWLHSKQNMKTVRKLQPVTSNQSTMVNKPSVCKFWCINRYAHIIFIIYEYKYILYLHARIFQSARCWSAKLTNWGKYFEMETADRNIANRRATDRPLKCKQQI